MSYLRMEDELLLDNDGPLLYQGKDLRLVAESLGISIHEIRRILGISITEVQLLTTVGELQEAYRALFSGEKKNNVTERMEKHFRPRLEKVPKDINHIHQINNIRSIVFNENPVQKEAIDWINKIAEDFLKKAREKDLEKIWEILKLEVINDKNRGMAKRKYSKFQSMRDKRSFKKDLAKIKRTNSLKGLNKLVSGFNRRESQKKASEKLELRCREEIQKVAISKNYKKAKEIYVLSRILQRNRFDYPDNTLTEEILEVWKKICLEAENEEEVLKHLWERDYDDREDDYLTIQPGAFEILDEIYVRKITSATTLEKVEQLEKEAPRQFMSTSRSQEKAKEKKKKMIKEKLRGASISEAEKIYKLSWADNEIKKIVIEKMLES